MKFTLTLIFLLAFTMLFGQTVGINTANPDPCAALDVNSTNQGVLIPRIALTSTADVTTIPNPAISLLVYNTTTVNDITEDFYFWNGVKWTLLNDTQFSWSINGNVGTYTGGGLNPIHNFIGTLDEQPLDFRTNDTHYLRLTTQGALEFWSTGHTIRIGMNSGYYDDKSNNQNVFIGSFSGFRNTIGEHNVAVGTHNLTHNVIGNLNTALGYQTLTDNVNGNENVAVGSHSNLATNSQTCTSIGSYSYNSTISYNNSTALGFNTQITSDNQMRFGDVNINSIGGIVGWSTLSDGRFKTNVKQDVSGLEFILQLRPVTYDIDIEELHRYHNTTEELQGNFTYRRQTGFIAQDVAETIDLMGINFSGVDYPTSENDHYGLRYAEFVVPLVKAVQELSTHVEHLENEIAKLKG